MVGGQISKLETAIHEWTGSLRDGDTCCQGAEEPHRRHLEMLGSVEGCGRVDRCGSSINIAAESFFQIPIKLYKRYAALRRFHLPSWTMAF